MGRQSLHITVALSTEIYIKKKKILTLVPAVWQIEHFWAVALTKTSEYQSHQATEIVANTVFNLAEPWQTWTPKKLWDNYLFFFQENPLLTSVICLADHLNLLISCNARWLQCWFCDHKINPNRNVCKVMFSVNAPFSRTLILYCNLSPLNWNISFSSINVSKQGLLKQQTRFSWERIVWLVYFPRDYTNYF